MGTSSTAPSEGAAPGLTLIGRRGECETLDRLLADLVASRSQALVLRGEAGIGKSVLLDELARRASGCRIARAWGIESEMELAFAGLHQLCAPLLGQLDHLPAPQRDALATAFGLSAGPPPDRFLVGLAVLSLLSHVAEERPLVCLVDDAQWLDRASTQCLEFVARRLLAESVALVLTARTDGTEPGFATMPELVLQGLSEDDARELLASTLSGPLDSAVRERILADSRGNPLALLEAPHGLTPAELAGGFGLPHTQPVAGYLEDGFRKRLEPLPVDTRLLMLVAALEPVGDVSLLWRAVGRLGIAAGAAAAAESAGLLALGTRVRFRHPLVRSAVCRAANPYDLRDAHRVLAEETDPDLDGDRRAWHLAHAADGPDEAVADELERSAERARTRGGVAAAAAFLKRATELTPDPADRGRRALAAARSAIDAGAPQRANDLLAAAEMCPLEDVERAELERLRAEAVFTLTRGSQTAPLLLLQAAKRLEPLDLGLARETYLDALNASQLAGRIGLREIAEAAHRLPPANPARSCDLLLDALATRFTQGCAAGAPLLKRALEAFRDPDLPPEDALRWHFLATTAALFMWDEEALEALTSRHLELARQSGSLAVLPLALNSRIATHVIAGELRAAAALVEEVSSVVEASGNYMPPYGALLVAAWRGDGSGSTDPAAAAVKDLLSRGTGPTIVEWATAIRAVGAGRYQDALEAVREAGRCPAELAVSTWALAEVVEATSRMGMPEQAAEDLRQLTETTQAAGTDWARGVEARCRALVSVGEEAESYYLQAIEHLGRSRVRLELARSHLVYGEWLRRAGRRVEARTQLRTAYELLTAMGAEGFAERTRRELLATGETVRSRNVESPTQLTAQEAQIARLAVENLTNPEIGAQLFISSRTVEWHLRKVFTKVGVSSRRELRAKLPAIQLSASST